MKEIDWSKAPEGWKLVPIKPTPEMRSAAGAAECMAVRERRQFFAGDSWLPMVRNAPEYSAPEWTGEGLPPVGTACEWLECKQTGWQVVEVAGYYKNAAWIVPEGKEPLTVFNPANFRPLRTPEQIAAEERRAAILDMKGHLSFSDYREAEQHCAALYDAGYRKVTP
ncbi:MAG: hypothetical protein ACLGIW_08110 [Gammaproteobacteria bacterium]